MILLVDDDEAVRDYTAFVLEEAGFSIRTARNADDAERIIAAGEPIELLITDIVMPGRSGVELARAFQQARPGGKVLFTTGFTRHIAPELARGELLDKPYLRDSLLHAVRRLVGTPLAPAPGHG